jgi:hypothetical protein
MLAPFHTVVAALQHVDPQQLPTCHLRSTTMQHIVMNPS